MGFFAGAFLADDVAGFCGFCGFADALAGFLGDALLAVSFSSFAMNGASSRTFNPRFLPFNMRSYFSCTSVAMKNAGVFTDLPLNNGCSDHDDSGLSLGASAMRH